jgi:uncharacterized integral membrane protein
MTEAEDGGRPVEVVRMTPEEREVFERRRRQRNWAILLVLLALVVLFFFISTARLLRG